MHSNSKRIPSTLREKQHKSQADFFRKETALAIHLLSLIQNPDGTR